MIQSQCVSFLVGKVSGPPHVCVRVGTVKEHMHAPGETGHWFPPHLSKFLPDSRLEASPVCHLEIYSVGVVFLDTQTRACLALDPRGQVHE